MTTLVTTVRLNKTELYNRQRLFDATYGIALDPGLGTTSLDLNLEHMHELTVNNFLFISTDSTLDLRINQFGPVVGLDNHLTYVNQTIVFPVSGVFLTYAKLGVIQIQRNANIKRIPKLTIIYA